MALGTTQISSTCQHYRMYYCSVFVCAACLCCGPSERRQCEQHRNQLAAQIDTARVSRVGAAPYLFVLLLLLCSTAQQLCLQTMHLMIDASAVMILYFSSTYVYCYIPFFCSFGSFSALNITPAGLIASVTAAAAAAAAAASAVRFLLAQEAGRVSTAASRCWCSVWYLVWLQNDGSVLATVRDATSDVSVSRLLLEIEKTNVHLVLV